MKKLFGVGSNVGAKVNGEVKPCRIMYMKASGIGVKLISRGRKVHNVRQADIVSY